MTKLLVMIYCKQLIKRLPVDDEFIFYSKNGYAIAFKNLLELRNENYWQNVNIQVFKCHKNGIVNGVAFYPKQSNAFTKVNPIHKYFSSYRKILNGEIKNEMPTKKNIKAFKKAIWWFPFQINLEKAFNE